MTTPWKTSGWLETLQALLDDGKTPAACARFFQQELGWFIRPSAIRLAIRRYGLRYKPRETGHRAHRDKVESGQLTEPAIHRETVQPPRINVDYTPHDEDPGDGRTVYRGVSMAMTMPRRRD